MHFKTLFAAAATVAFATAQNASLSLADALNSTADLSTLNTLLGQYPDVLSMLTNATNITILAPSNSALEPLMSNPDLMAAAAVPGFVPALLQYHVLNGTVYSQNVSSTPTFVHTLLSNETYSNVTGGQVVGARLTGGDDGNVTIYSGSGATANVTQADIAVANGTVVHIIDAFLTIPQNVSTVASSAGLSALVGALQATNLTDAIDSATDITVFAPTNAAFEAIGSTLGNLSTEDAASILQYHVVNGTVAYSSLLANGTNVTSMAGAPLNITIEDGEVFVNSARVIAADVLVSGGVVHIIDSVLNPNSTTVADPENDEGVPVYSGASSGAVPYTSNVPTPATTIVVMTTNAVASGYTVVPTDALGSASQSAADATSSAGAAMQTGAVGAAALFGGAALLANW